MGYFYDIIADAMLSKDVNLHETPGLENSVVNERQVYPAEEKHTDLKQLDAEQNYQPGKSMPDYTSLPSSATGELDAKPNTIQYDVDNPHREHLSAGLSELDSEIRSEAFSTVADRKNPKNSKAAINQVGVTPTSDKDDEVQIDVADGSISKSERVTEQVNIIGASTCEQDNLVAGMKSIYELSEHTLNDADQVPRSSYRVPKPDGESAPLSSLNEQTYSEQSEPETTQVGVTLINIEEHEDLIDVAPGSPGLPIDVSERVNKIVSRACEQQRLAAGMKSIYELSEGVQEGAGGGADQEPRSSCRVVNPEAKSVPLLPLSKQTNPGQPKAATTKDCVTTTGDRQNEVHNTVMHGIAGTPEVTTWRDELEKQMFRNKLRLDTGMKGVSSPTISPHDQGRLSSHEDIPGQLHEKGADKQRKADKQRVANKPTSSDNTNVEAEKVNSAKLNVPDGPETKTGNDSAGTGVVGAGIEVGKVKLPISAEPIDLVNRAKPVARRYSIGQQKAPSPPAAQIHIGQIDVLVQAPISQDTEIRPSSSPLVSGDFSSRFYLRDV